MEFMSIEDILKKLEISLINLAESLGNEYKDLAIADAKTFLKESEADLLEWSKLLVQDKISQDEFQSLLNGKKDLWQMVLLKNKGLGIVKIDQFKNRLIQIIIELIITAAL